MDVTLIVATFGDDQWAELGASTAAAHDAVHVHGPDLATARNQAAQRATTEWLIYVDADDWLEPGYVDAMAEAYGDLRAPGLQLHYPDRTTVVDLTARDIERTNPCPIGTAIRRSMLLDCGGFPTFPAWEDWGLFLRAHRRGATITHVPGAVYHARMRPGSRNQSVADASRLYRDIRAWA